MMMKKWIMLLFAFSAAGSLAAGCGYSLHRKADLPFTEIRIVAIENKTLEPKLHDKLQEALAEEFAKNGIAVTRGAAAQLSGVIRHYEMISLSEKDGTTVEYRVIIAGDFTFRDADGRTKEIKKQGSPFIVSFSGSQDMANLLGNRDLAERQALSDTAMEIVGELIFP